MPINKKSLPVLLYILLCLMSRMPTHAENLATPSDSRTDSTVIYQYLNMARGFEEQYKDDSAGYYYTHASKLALKFKNPSILYDFYSRYSRYLYNKAQYERALVICQKQLQLSLSIGEDKKIAASYNNLGLQHHALGHLPLAANYMIKALKISDTVDDKVNQQKYYSNISSIFLDLKDKKNSLMYAQKGYELAKGISALQAARSLINLSASEALNDKTVECIAHLKEVANIAKQAKDSLLEIHAYINLGDVENRENHYEAALGYYKKASEKLGDAPIPDYRMYIEYGLANSLKNLNKSKLAYPYLRSTLTVAEELMPKNDLKEVYLLAADIYEEIDKPEKALEVLRKYTVLNDSLLNVSTQKAIHEIDSKYQVSKRDQKLTDQKLQLSEKEIEIEKKNKWILTIMVLLSLVVALSVIAYLVYRNKNQFIELSLLKAQIHPHFLFNTLNNLYALSLKKSDKAPNLVLGLSEILRYILYECNQPEISLKKELEMIRRYIELEGIRYVNRLEINLNTDQKEAEIKIAPLLLLPLVENAFKHGISKLSDQGWISIESRISHGSYIFKISNNTTPTVSSEQGIHQNGLHIGLGNIKKRLQLLYPSRHQLRILKESDIFIVTMSIKI